ncbi:MAG: hypothetical protein AAB390_03185 [Patescibacteria group bacterium]
MNHAKQQITNNFEELKDERNECWKRVIDFTKIKTKGVTVFEILSRLYCDVGNVSGKIIK